MTELTELNFSPLNDCHECFGTYENSRGQRFLIRVSGCSKDKVEQGIKNLRVFLEVYSGNSEEMIEYANHSGEKNISLQNQEILEIEENVDQQNEVDELKLSVEADGIQNFNQLSNLRFAFTNQFSNINVPIINGDERPVSPKNSIVLRTGNNPVNIQVRFTVSPGSAVFRLLEASSLNGAWKLVSKQEVSASSGTQILTGRVGANKYFKLTVQGESGSRFTVNGEHWLPGNLM